MSRSKQEKINRLQQLVEQSKYSSDKQLSESLAAYQNDIDMDTLRLYMEQQLQQDRLLQQTADGIEKRPNPFEFLSKVQLTELSISGNHLIATGAKLELARRDLFTFCNLRAPDFYKSDRAYLVRLCRELEDFYKTPEEMVMIVALPPRHGKSRTAGLFTQWVYGQDQSSQIMTGSYNVTLSTTFSKTVRNGISEAKAQQDKIVYSDIFPEVKIQRGDAAMNLWSLEGQHASYLATSPDGTATGFGASLMVIDDLIKAAEEAFNDDKLAAQFSWFTDTMLSRLEKGGKIIIIMTRWASGDLAGRVKEMFLSQGLPVREVVMKALQDDGTMLCDDVLDHADYLMKTRAMSPEIASANYQQIPVDVKGRLYVGFKTYEVLPADERGRSLCTGIYNYTDTADEGSDWLCSIDYAEYNGEAYVLNIVYTQEGMEATEPAVAQMLDEDKVNVADVESNNGGRGFARNVQSLLKQKHKNRRCVVKWFHQSENKKARILSNATWVMEHIYFPVNWRDRWPEYHKAMNSYQRSGKNAHDDAPDATTGVAEHFVKPQHRLIIGRRRYGL